MGTFTAAKVPIKRQCTGGSTLPPESQGWVPIEASGVCHQKRAYGEMTTTREWGPLTTKADTKNEHTHLVHGLAEHYAKSVRRKIEMKNPAPSHQTIEVVR